MWSEIDIRATEVVLQAKSAATGVLPMAVMLCPPGSEHHGWRKAAIDHLMRVAQARAQGLTPPNVVKEPIRKEGDYAEADRIPS